MPELMYAFLLVCDYLCSFEVGNKSKLCNFLAELRGQRSKVSILAFPISNCDT